MYYDRHLFSLKGKLKRREKVSDLPRAHSWEVVLLAFSPGQADLGVYVLNLKIIWVNWAFHSLCNCTQLPWTQLPPFSLLSPSSSPQKPGPCQVPTGMSIASQARAKAAGA